MGVYVGTDVGVSLGTIVSVEVGIPVGIKDGALVGICVGVLVGVSVGKPSKVTYVYPIFFVKKHLKFMSCYATYAMFVCHACLYIFFKHVRMSCISMQNVSKHVCMLY